MSFSRNVAMTRQRQQYRTSDDRCLFIDLSVYRKLPCEQLIDVGPRIEAAVSISMRSSMLRKAMVVLAIVLVLGSSGLSTSAFARSGGHGGGGRGDSFRGNHLRGGFGGIRGDSFGGYRNGTGGLHSGLRGMGAAMCGATARFAPRRDRACSTPSSADSGGCFFASRRQTQTYP
jgi:hypothetical protein